MSDEGPLVCICVPTYNAGKTIRETLVSIVDQSYRNLTILIVDNASQDDTLDVVETFSDPRISIHRNDVNVGGEGNFNRCIQLAKGKYTAIYHADDVYEPQMVARQVAFLEVNPKAGAVFTEASLIDDDGKVIGSLGIPRNLVSKGPLYDFETVFKSVLKNSNFLICPSAMVRTDVYQRDVRRWHGEAFKTSADLDVWLRISQSHSIGICPERLMRYRISLSQYSAKLRARTWQSDLFLVMDYYLSMEKVKNFLLPQDWIYYARLQRTDRIARAINLYLIDRERDALTLCRNTLDVDAWRAAMSGRRGLMTLVASIFLHIFYYSNLPRVGKLFFKKMRRLAGR